MVGLQTLDLAIGVRVPASQPNSPAIDLRLRSAFRDHGQTADADKISLVVRDERDIKVKGSCGNPSIGSCNRSPAALRTAHCFGPKQRQGVRRMLDDVSIQM